MNIETRFYTYGTKVDEGLRAYMLSVYRYMAIALFVTSLSSMAVLSSNALASLIFQFVGHVPVGFTRWGYIMTFAPFVIVIYFSFGFGRMSLGKAKSLFWIYAALMGVSLSSLGFIYTGISLIKTFLICSSLFAAMSIYGHGTKRDLTEVGAFLYMGFIGLVIAGLVNMLLGSAMVEFVLSVLGVFIFTGLIAFDTQKIKAIYYSVGGGEAGQKIAIMSALTLYLDFVNLFVYLLRFIGVRRDE